jgi:hypothetical protein
LVYEIDETQSVLVDALWPLSVRPDNDQVSISMSKIESFERISDDALNGTRPTS